MLKQTRTQSFLGGAQRIVGKTEGRKQLVHFSFKMAANMADKLHRPFHSAFSQGLLPCPHQRYIDNCSFYTKDGLSHHSRCLHGKPDEAIFPEFVLPITLCAPCISFPKSSASPLFHRPKSDWVRVWW